MDTPSPSIIPADESSFYSCVHQERFECILKCLEKDPNHAFVIDLFDFLHQCINQNSIMNMESIITLIRLVQSWQSVRCIHAFHRILRQDLRLRPAFVSTEIIDELKRYLNLCLQCMRSKAHAPSLEAVQLALSYFTEVLTCWINHHSAVSNGSSIVLSQKLSFATKWTFFTKVIDLLFSVSKRLEQPNLQPDHLLIYHNLLADLNKLLCVPLVVDDNTVQSISVTFEGKLSDAIYSNALRRQVISGLQSPLLRRSIIDIHLDKEFKLVSSVSEALQNEPFNLSKFCCIHLCRLPYDQDGKMHYDLSYFLYLLYTLIESHLLLITGLQPISCVTAASKKKALPEGFKHLVESMRPHIAGLVDRMSEDEVLISELTDSHCWSGIQNLSWIIDAVLALE